MDSLQDEGHMSPFLGGISHSLRSHVTLPQVLHDIQQSGCEGDSRRTIHDKTTTKKFLRVGGGRADETLEVQDRGHIIRGGFNSIERVA